MSNYSVYLKLTRGFFIEGLASYAMAGKDFHIDFNQINLKSRSINFITNTQFDPYYFRI